MSAEEERLLKSYFALRSLIKSNDDSNPKFVFVNHTGKHMTQSNVAAALTAAFKSTFENRATCTKLRKAAVTQVHGTEPSQKHNVAAHMCTYVPYSCYC